ncbi:hypothetical protein [Paenibacillus sp. QZ-Y1]|uniref:hypothetical protein n=1 Tax=Paenibacillus sp. QZ-Y1 TaxID=3414511 RepID=UPI003F78E18C
MPWHNAMIYAMLRDDRAMVDSQLYGVDVRDAAATNIALMKSTAANGKRHFSSAFKSTYSTLLNLIKEQFTNEQIKTLLGDAARIIPRNDAADLLGHCYSKSYYYENFPGK